MHHEDKKRALLNLLLDYAPNAAAQAKVAEIVHKAEMDGMDNAYVIQMLVATLYDGLTYKNWPWS